MLTVFPNKSHFQIPRCGTEAKFLSVVSKQIIGKYRFFINNKMCLGRRYKGIIGNQFQKYAVVVNQGCELLFVTSASGYYQKTISTEGLIFSCALFICSSQNSLQRQLLRIQ